MLEEEHKEDSSSEEEEDPGLRHWVRREEIISREVARLPWVPRLIPDSDLDLTYVLQIHPSGVKHTDWPEFKVTIGVKSRFPQPIVIHGRQSVYDLFTIVWTQWFSKWRKACMYGCDEDVDEHLWYIEVGLPERRNKSVGNIEETGWLPQKYVSDMRHEFDPNPETFGHYEYMGTARNRKVGNMELETEDIRLNICYDYGSPTIAHLQVIKIERAQQQP